MSEIITTIDIDAPVEIVWDILTDLERYAEWNPFIRESRGEATLGCRLTCRPEVIKGRIQTFHPVVTRVEKPKVFAWTGIVGLPWLAEGEHIFELEALGENRTHHVHRMEYRGLLAPLMGAGLISNKTRLGFIRMNEALKKRAEEGGHPTSKG